MLARVLQDSDVMSGLMFFAIAALVIVVAVLAYRADKQRREALTRFAASLGFSYDRDGGGDFVTNRLHRWFDRGHSKKTRNRIEGSRELAGLDCQVYMGDFHYVTGSGKNQSSHAHSYLLLTLPWRGIPNMEIRTEHLLDKLGDAMGFDDIDFESAEFSRRFMVKSADKRFAYAVIHPRMMEYLMSQDKYGFHIDRANAS
ncbi:MAG: hypothetical protein FJ202_04885 [Gemmatimonadetes bacterium]|nr:hypothetical protein [Gemmatimonadota bacterium]